MSSAERQLDLYPAHLRAEIDAINAWVYPNINNGVYRAGFAQSQEAYDVAVHEIFEHLERAEVLLGKHRFLTGNKLTEADVRLVGSHALPQTSSGKLSRSKARAAFLAGAFDREPAGS